MDQQKVLFIQKEFVRLLRETPNAERKWGKMNLHQMTEHVTDFFNVSTGKIQLPVVTPKEHLPKFKTFLFSDKEFRENTKAPVEIVAEEPVAIRNTSFDVSVMQLEESIQYFFEFFQENPTAITSHPVFGPLNFEEWILLHYKHVRHHSKQFGLITG